MTEWGKQECQVCFEPHAHVVQGSEFCHGKLDRCHLREAPNRLELNNPSTKGQPETILQKAHHYLQQKEFPNFSKNTKNNNNTVFTLHIFVLVPKGWDLNNFRLDGFQWFLLRPRSCEPMVSSRAHSCRQVPSGPFSVVTSLSWIHTWVPYLGYRNMCICIYIYTLPETNSLHLKIGFLKRKGLSSNPFSGASC